MDTPHFPTPEELEEELLPTDRKESRRERKRLINKDRSQYKRSDQDQLRQMRAREAAERPSGGEERLGRVLSIATHAITVESEGVALSCVLRRTLFQERQRVKNLVTVGDIVALEITSPGEAVINQIKERYSLLSRADNLDRRKEQLIAANIDQVLITTSCHTPPLKPAIIDRYIIAARKGRMRPILIINKVDLIETEQEASLFQAIVATYQEVGLLVIPVSTRNSIGLNALKSAMQGKASVFAGQSGVGKSSLINAATGLSLKIGDIVARTKKGTHTTTRATLIPLELGGTCIDTPGIKRLGLWELVAQEIKTYFTEIAILSRGCRFPNCLHLSEPECAVIAALEEGRLSPYRYTSYATLLEEIRVDNVRR